MKAQLKVGILFLGSLILIVIFGFLLGFFAPFQSSNELILAYNFAGGIEVGSPVRAMGIKVGKVKSIQFDPGYKMPNGEEVKLKIAIDINKDAWPTVRRDSRFFINLAGVIGEKYIEISPGTMEQPMFQPGDYVRGEDPPRIDQLLSQGYALAGKVLEMVEKNGPTIADTLQKMDSLVTNLNKTLVLFEKVSNKREFKVILGNTEQLTNDLLILTSKLRGPEAERTMALLHTLLFRLEKLDDKAIKKFLQDEGIKARFF